MSQNGGGGQGSPRLQKRQSLFWASERSSVSVYLGLGSTQGTMGEPLAEPIKSAPLHGSELVFPFKKSYLASASQTVHCSELTGVPQDVRSSLFHVALLGAAILNQQRSCRVHDGPAKDSWVMVLLREGTETAVSLGTAIVRGKCGREQVYWL